ncbi:replication associated protein [Dipodfec virus UA06Rod_119]|uniref:Replication-associated protein n=1 Tax=Dipodfec virus UA06Rod_119 TaxID=2929248 RepID=A0A976N1K4_9VIRU|nr:replication associated protein [Dipodfec virus UA06Rod_119]
MSGQGKAWCGTLQLEGDFDGERYLREMVEQGKAKFAVGQIEQGSHLHLQYYVQTEKRVRLNYLKNICPKTHWEQAKGTPEQNIAYCSKASTRIAGPWSFGELSGQGKRNDIEKAANMLDSGMSMRQVAVECKSTFIKFHKGLRAYEAVTRSKGPRQIGPEGPEVWVFWGPSGTGKSRRAFESWPDAYRKMTSDKWWDGYLGQETVIFDDFKGSAMRLHDFQIIIDRYPVQVEVKGACVDLSATRYVFTCNKHPKEWYSEEADPEGTVMRRITEFCSNHGRLIHCVQEVNEFTELPPSWLEAWQVGTHE